MRSNHLRWLTPLACLGLLAATGSANATVVWTSGFETGDLSEWTPGINATKTLPDGMVRQNIVVEQAQVYTGKYACEITVHPDDLFANMPRIASTSSTRAPSRRKAKIRGSPGTT
jgi:hypothetical protein